MNYNYGYIGNLAGLISLTFLVLGILALIPTPPFPKRDLAIGISFIVLAVIGVGSIVTGILNSVLPRTLDTRT